MTKYDSFERLLMHHSEVLIHCLPEKHYETWQKLALEALYFFDIDRISLYQKFLLLFENNWAIAVARPGVPQLGLKNVSHSDSEAMLSYVNHLDSDAMYHFYDEEQLAKTKNRALTLLHQEGVTDHYIMPFSIFGNRWGGVSFSTYKRKSHLNEEKIKQLKLLCEVWICYWQHSTFIANSHQKQSALSDDDKLSLLSGKQVKILHLFAQSLTAKEIAKKLNVSYRTIESHKYRMVEKLELENSAELMHFALRNSMGMGAGAITDE